MVEIAMPDLGQTTDEIKIISWEVEVGDKVDKGDMLCSVETDKATTEVESYASGVVKEIKVEEGEVVKAGSTIIILE